MSAKNAPDGHFWYQPEEFSPNLCQIERWTVFLRADSEIPPEDPNATDATPLALLAHSAPVKWTMTIGR